MYSLVVNCSAVTKSQADKLTICHCWVSTLSLTADSLYWMSADDADSDN